MLTMRMVRGYIIILGVASLLVMSNAAAKSSNNEEADEEKIRQLKNAIGLMSAQTMALQLNLEETIRQYGHSGLKKVRATIEGTRNYHSASHINQHSVAAIHDHSNNIRVVGLGELDVVLNGIDFRTRHNDYHVVKPTTEHKRYHVTEDIEYPDVPPEVLEKATPEEQVDEMREWFRAWAEQDHSVRDFRPYFRPILCYLEGAFTTTGNQIDEDFESDRHHLEAATWFELQEKIRFTSANGRKSLNENFAYLPTVIIGIVNDTYPMYAQWNYRLLCAPVKNDIPLNRLRLIDDVIYRMAKNVEFKDIAATRAARYQLNPVDSDEWGEGITQRNFLDELMEQIPGKDNYPGEINDDAFADRAVSWEDGHTGINAGYYHRWYRSRTAGISGDTMRHRGFVDENMYFALNTRQQIAPIEYTDCDGNECRTYKYKMSFAFPLEIIYMTPLYNWNPYNIEYKGNGNSEWAQTVEEGGRNGGLTLAKAYNGTHSRVYFRTPAEFFNGETSDGDPADTSKGVVGVLDADGNMHRTMASGTYIHFPEIEGLGILRQRYPIMPVHGEGTQEWKELEALKDIVLKSQTYGHMIREKK